MKKYRLLTLIACVLNIAIATAAIIGDIVIISRYIHDVANYYIIVGSGMLNILISSVVLIITSFLVGKANRTIKGFNRCKGLVITLFALDCILAINNCLSIVNYAILRIFVIIFIVASGAFLMIDLIDNKPAELEEIEPIKENKQENLATSKQNNSIDSLTENLLKVKKLKDAELISEEEYQTLRAKTIDDIEF